MIIALTQREFEIKGWKYDCHQQDWYKFLEGHELTVIPNQGIFDFSKPDLLILSGGNNSTNREDVERLAVEAFTADQRPIFGVCHGAFALNKFFGGSNTTIEGHQGPDHSVTLEGKEVTVNSYHQGCIGRLADCFQPLARDEMGNVEAFRHVSLPIWGVVWHPERMPSPVLPTDLEELLND